MQTVIAGFNEQAEAERAADELVQRGFDRGDIHIEQPNTTGSTKENEDKGEDRSTGGISGFFSRLFGSDDDYERHGSTWNEAVRRGNFVVVVDAEDEGQATEAAQCLGELGAIDIDEQTSKWRAEGWTGSTSETAMPNQSPRGTLKGKEGVMNVVQEELKVGKRNVDMGGVRVVQRVSSKPVREVIHLRDERAVVNRRPVDRPAEAGDLSAFKEGSMEVRESAEEAVVSKSARVVEEVQVGKDVRERDEVIEDKLRRKDVDVERLPAGERERAFAADKKSPLTGSRDDNPGGRSADSLRNKDRKGGPQ